MPDPDFLLNCPHCGNRLTYVTSERIRDGSLARNETHVYLCARHGEFRLSPDGQLNGAIGAG